MKQQIDTQINNVCLDKELTCLHAIESGSRAWGFSSPDSDYDVRLIYKNEPDWYLRLFAERDTFEYIDNDLFDVPFDIGGWDIRKALTLVYKSNAVVFEWLNSPIIYQSNDEFLTLITDLQLQFFNPRAIFYHYRGMANNANKVLELTKPIKLKKWFYLLRSLLASVWTLNKLTPPPVLMEDMFELLTSSEQYELKTLMNIKQTVDESYLHQMTIAQQHISTRLWQLGSELIANHSIENNKGDVRLLDEVFKTVVFKT